MNRARPHKLWRPHPPFLLSLAVDPVFDPFAGVQNGKRFFSSPGCNSPAPVFSPLPRHVNSPDPVELLPAASRARIATPASLLAADCLWGVPFRRRPCFHAGVGQGPREASHLTLTSRGLEATKYPLTLLATI
ncbi:hypothetical protein IMZ48_38865 [Candidatus Bathyarchaeota archaeon]|nr:hypothetical protein [Candidatus Bathyarchaeota archaeon]